MHHHLSSALAVASVLSTTSAAFSGFNYGNTFSDGRIKSEADFKKEFQTAQKLEGTDGAFNSARLYTMVQGGSASAPIEAIPAAIDTKTSLLLGLWASAGEAAFSNELDALKNSIEQYGDDLKSLVAGISIGSEDLYRASPMGVKANENPGAEPDILVKYINQVRDVIKGTVLEGAKLGHVDTWTAFVNGSNNAVIDACDWLGMDAYPYFEDTHTNDISNGRKLFLDALAATEGAAGGKEVWITETGWPVSGKTVGDAKPSPENAEKFWKNVGCPMFESTNVWWYTMQDANPETPNPSFGVIGSDLTTEPLYDLSCDGVKVPDDDDEDGKDEDGKDEDGKDEDGKDEDKDDEDNEGDGQGEDENDSADNGGDSNDGDNNEENGGDDDSNSDESNDDTNSGSGDNSDSSPANNPESGSDSGIVTPSSTGNHLAVGASIAAALVAGLIALS